MIWSSSLILHATGTCNPYNGGTPLGCVCSRLRYDKKQVPRVRSHEWYEKRFHSMECFSEYIKYQPRDDYDSMKIHPRFTFTSAQSKTSCYSDHDQSRSRSYKYRDGSRVFIGTIAKVFTATVDENMGPIKFITDQPGRQLLSGSFHPVNDDNWDHGVLTRPLLSAYRQHQQQLSNNTGDSKATDALPVALPSTTSEDTSTDINTRDNGIDKLFEVKS
jgi:hypothetical protein